jgi:TolA-binding protein
MKSEFLKPGRLSIRLVSLMILPFALLALGGCAAKLWPPSQWSLSLNLARPNASEAAPVTDASARASMKDPTNTVEALAYAQTLCTLPPDDLNAEIARLQGLQASKDQDINTLRAQQLAFARQLAQLYAEQKRLQDTNEEQAQQIRERQSRIDQLNGQIKALRAVEYNLPNASPATASPVPAPALSAPAIVPALTPSNTP